MSFRFLRHWMIIGLLFGTMSLPALALDLDLGNLLDIGKKVTKLASDVSEEEEIEIGGNLVSGLLGAAPLVEDAELQRYVNDVGYWVASRSGRPDLPWTFGVIDSAGINAFAAPGGYVVLTVGLFNLLENEAQLAGVLAHEIAHVVEKHHLEALESQMSNELWGDLAIAATEDRDDREKLGVLVNSGVQLYAKGLDRDLEHDADLHGVVLAARAGYDPYALLDVLTTIDSINPDSSELTVFLNTHPPVDERLRQLAESMDGRLDRYASGQTNLRRFQRISAAP